VYSFIGQESEACGEIGHWEELCGKVDELLHATDHPDNYPMHIQIIIQYSSVGVWQFNSLLQKKACAEHDRGNVVIWSKWLCIDPSRHPTTTGGQGRLDI